MAEPLDPRRFDRTAAMPVVRKQDSEPALEASGTADSGVAFERPLLEIFLRRHQASALTDYLKQAPSDQRRRLQLGLIGVLGGRRSREIVTSLGWRGLQDTRQRAVRVRLPARISTDFMAWIPSSRSSQSSKYEVAMRRAAGEHASMTPVETATPQARGGGLPARVRLYAERLLGHSFADVEIVIDRGFCSRLNAEAVTIGSRIYFPEAQGGFETKEKRERLLHELTHVVQGRQGRMPVGHGPGLHVLSYDHPLEVEARAQEARAAAPIAYETKQDKVVRSLVAPVAAGNSQVAARSSWWQSATEWAKDKAWQWAKSIIAGWGIDPERFVALFAKAGDVIALVKKVISAPGEFFQNLVKTLIGGAEAFWANKWEILRSGVIAWLTGRTGIVISEFSVAGMFDMLMQLVGLGKQKLEAQARAHIEKRQAKEEAAAEAQTTQMVEQRVDEEVDRQTRQKGIRGRAAQLKTDARKRIKDTGFLGQVLGYVKEKLRILMQSGFRGLFESLAGDIKGLFAGLFQELMQDVWQRMLVEGAKAALMLVVPFGGLVKLAQMAWTGLQWVIHNAGRLLGILETVGEFITDIVNGRVPPAAMGIKNTLTQLVAPLLDAIRRFLNLPEFTKKISDFCSRVSTKVQKSFTSVLDKLYDKASKLFPRKNVEATAQASAAADASETDRAKAKPRPRILRQPYVVRFRMGSRANPVWHRIREVLSGPELGNRAPYLIMASKEKDLEDRTRIAENSNGDESKRLARDVKPHLEAWRTSVAKEDGNGALAAINGAQAALSSSPLPDFGDTELQSKPLDQLTGEEIVLAIAEKLPAQHPARRYGREQLQTELYDRYRRFVFGLVLKIVRTIEDAEEICTDVFTQMFADTGAASLRAYEPERARNGKTNGGSDPMFSFFSTVARSRAIDWTRSRAGKIDRYKDSLDEHERNPLFAAAHTQEEHSVAQQRTALLHQQMPLVMTPVQYEVELLILLDCAHSDIEKILNVPLGTVKTRTLGARRSLAKRMKALADKSQPIAARQALRTTCEPDSIAAQGRARVQEMQASAKKMAAAYHGLSTSDSNAEAKSARVGAQEQVNGALDLRSSQDAFYNHPQFNSAAKAIQLLHPSSLFVFVHGDATGIKKGPISGTALATNGAAQSRLSSLTPEQLSYVIDREKSGTEHETIVFIGNHPSGQSEEMKRYLNSFLEHWGGTRALLYNFSYAQPVGISKKPIADILLSKNPDIDQAMLKSQYGWFRMEDLTTRSSKNLVEEYSGRKPRSVRQDFVALTPGSRGKRTSGHGSGFFYHKIFEGSARETYREIVANAIREELYYDAVSNNGHIYESELDEKQVIEMEYLESKGLFQKTEKTSASRHWVLIFGLRGAIRNPLRKPGEDMAVRSDVVELSDKGIAGWFTIRELEAVSAGATNFVLNHSVVSGNTAQLFVVLRSGERGGRYFHRKTNDDKFNQLFAYLEQNELPRRIFCEALENNGHYYQENFGDIPEKEIAHLVSLEVFRKEEGTSGQNPHWILLGSQRPPRRLPKSQLQIKDGKDNSWPKFPPSPPMSPNTWYKILVADRNGLGFKVSQIELTNGYLRSLRSQPNSPICTLGETGQGVTLTYTVAKGYGWPADQPLTEVNVFARMKPGFAALAELFRRRDYRGIEWRDIEQLNSVQKGTSNLVTGFIRNEIIRYEKDAQTGTGTYFLSDNWRPTIDLSWALPAADK